MYDWELKDDALKAWVRLRQASDTVERLLESGLGKDHATLAQIDVLAILSVSKASLTPGEIASYTFRQQHSASAQLTRMQRAGYVKKTRSQKDQRVVKVKMQPKGEDLLKLTSHNGLGKAQSLLKSCLSSAEIKQFDRLLKKVRNCALEQLGIEAQTLPKSISIPDSWPN